MLPIRFVYIFSLPSFHSVRYVRFPLPLTPRSNALQFPNKRNLCLFTKWHSFFKFNFPTKFTKYSAHQPPLRQPAPTSHAITNLCRIHRHFISFIHMLIFGTAPVAWENWNRKLQEMVTKIPLFTKLTSLRAYSVRVLVLSHEQQPRLETLMAGTTFDFHTKCESAQLHLIE